MKSQNFNVQCYANFKSQPLQTLKVQNYDNIKKWKYKRIILNKKHYLDTKIQQKLKYYLLNAKLWQYK